MSRLNKLFEEKQKDILNIYFTAGFPELQDTARIVLALDKAGVDLVEIGMPYSDPMADGETIQRSGAKALKNGMKLKILFEQLSKIRTQTNIPIILMGYFNQVMQYGERNFFQACKDVGVDGLILPDLPLEVYAREYKSLFTEYGLSSVFLLSPQSEDDRARRVDELSSGFIYVVADASITGGNKDITPEQVDYFNRIKALELKTPKLIGFGISNNKNFSSACEHAHGAIIGSAFIRALENDSSDEGIKNFVDAIRKG